MRYLILLFIITLSSHILAQTENKGQSIELPDFVITGVQSLDVPVISKKKAELVTTVSEEFLMPAYSPEEFSMSPGMRIMGKRIDLLDAEESFEGGLKIGAGKYTMPEGEFYLSQNWENYLFSANVWTTNIKDYVDNSGLAASGACIKNSIFIDTNSDFLPGSKISIDAQYKRSNYKFFGSTLTPSLERKTQHGLARLSFINVFNDIFNFGFDFSGRYFLLSDNDFNELLLKGQSLFELKFQRFGVKLVGDYYRQVLTNSLSSIDKYDYYSGHASLIIKPSNAFRIKLGAFYSEQNSESFFMPTASISFRLDKNIYLFGEFSPHTRFLTVNDFIDQNRYYEFSLVDNVLLKYNKDLMVTLKYEYEKYFEISAGFEYAQIDNFIYYEDLIPDGIFDLNTLNDVTKLGAFINSNFYLGPMGQFYGNISVNKVTDGSGDYLPYHPLLKSTIIYAYDFDFGFGFRIQYDMALNIHTDLTNTNKLNNYHNLACGLKYKLSDNFEIFARFENILQNKNYYMMNYDEKPFDIVGGIYYNW